MGDTHSCACHANAFAACDYPGGCGTTGGCCNTRKPACCLCAVYRPDADPRQPHRPPICEGDRALLDQHLNDIANLTADITNPETPVTDQRTYERFDRNGESLGHTWSDPLTTMGGVAPINSRSNQPSVSGSRERSIPIHVDTLDLIAPVRHTGVTASPKVRADKTLMRQWISDQIGHLSVASTLDQWVRDWRDTLHPDHHLPPATVDQLVLWLRNRVDHACDHHPAIAEFAEEIRILRGALRAAAKVCDPRPERCDGVPCRRCDMMTLFRQPGGDVLCINPDCQAVLREDEFREWVKTLAAEHRIKQARHVEDPSASLAA